MLKQFNINSLLVILIILVLNSCQAPEAYRRAVTAFSQGAELEMRDRFVALTGEAPEGIVSINNLYQAPAADPERKADEYYQEAMKELDAALKGESQLEKIDVFDNALAIKALTLWRQGKYDEAKATAQQALPLLEQDNGGENDFRDLAMMEALPGLINIDLAFNALQNTNELASQLSEASSADEKSMLYEKIKQNYLDFGASDEDGASSVARALTLVQRAIDKAPAEQDLRLYLLNSQLAGLDSWGDLRTEIFKAARRTNAGAEELAWLDEERIKYDGLVTSYLGKLAGMMPDGEESDLYMFWKRVL
jgi:hypothetical protein